VVKDLVERLLLVDHLIEVKHGGTEGTETHGGPGLSRSALGAGRA
jgi:hypothetical protein